MNARESGRRYPAGFPSGGSVDLTARALEGLGEQVEEVALFAGGLDRSVIEHLDEAGVAFAERGVAVDLHPFLGGGVGEDVAVGNIHFDWQADDVGDAFVRHYLRRVVAVDEKANLAIETKIAKALRLAEGEMDGGELLGADEVDAAGFADHFDRGGFDWAGQVGAGDVVGAADEIEQLAGPAGFERRAVGVGRKEIEAGAMGDETGPEAGVEMMSGVDGVLEEVGGMEAVEEGLYGGVAVEIGEKDALASGAGEAEGIIGGDGGGAAARLAGQEGDEVAGEAGGLGLRVPAGDGVSEKGANRTEGGSGGDIVANAEAEQRGKGFDAFLADGDDFDGRGGGTNGGDDAESVVEIGAVDDDEVDCVYAEGAVECFDGGVFGETGDGADRRGVGELAGIKFDGFDGGRKDGTVEFKGRHRDFSYDRKRRALGERT